MDTKQLDELEVYGLTGYVIITTGGVIWGSTFRVQRERCIEDFKKSVDFPFFDHNRWDCEEVIIMKKDALKSMVSWKENL